MATVFQKPRFWLLIWGGLGAAFLVYVIIAASVQPSGRTDAAGVLYDPALLAGEMADFVYALPPRAAPAAHFSSEDGDVALGDFRGKTVLVNIWATQCAPCLKELPSLDKLEGALGGEDFQVVAVAADPTGPDVARQFMDRLNIRHLKLYTDQRLSFMSAIGGVDYMPASILYDARGREIGRIIGEADWTSAEAKRLVAAAIAKK